MFNGKAAKIIFFYIPLWALGIAAVLVGAFFAVTYFVIYWL